MTIMPISMTSCRIGLNRGLAGLAALLCATTAATGARASDLVLVNGKIYTAGAAKWAEAIAITDGKIEKVGSSAEVLKTKTARTRVVDLQGKFVTPALSMATPTSGSARSRSTM
jgi:hypothetical protein